MEHPTIIGRLAKFMGDARAGQQLPGNCVPPHVVHRDDKNRPQTTLHFCLSGVVTHRRRQELDNVFGRKRV
jgi:hypothetical protein